jgi:hypothetical protein
MLDRYNTATTTEVDTHELRTLVRATRAKNPITIASVWMLLLDIMTAFSDENTMAPPIELNSEEHRHARAHWENVRGVFESPHFEQFIVQLRAENELACGHTNISYEYHSTIIIPLSS